MLQSRAGHWCRYEPCATYDGYLRLQTHSEYVSLVFHCYSACTKASKCYEQCLFSSSLIQKLFSRLSLVFGTGNTHNNLFRIYEFRVNRLSGSNTLLISALVKVRPDHTSSTILTACTVTDSVAVPRRLALAVELVCRLLHIVSPCCVT